MTIIEIKKIHRDNAGHWFDESTLRFFNSTIFEETYTNGEITYFVTSEKYEEGTVLQLPYWLTNSRKRESRPVLYTVRSTKTGVDINTVGEFQEYDTKKEAIDAITKLLDT